MNIVSYPQSNREIVYCIVDRIATYQSAWVQELTKNISDYTVSNIWSKKYPILVGLDEDALLKESADQGYKYAVVLSTGTEFINGSKFFDAVEELTKQDFFLAGHVLDRKDAWYELHHQCFVVNLIYYKKCGYPEVGNTRLGQKNYKIELNRSQENYHDDYTPISVSLGDRYREFNHEMHGYNILSSAVTSKFPILVFDDSIRNNKRYYYPESIVDFHKQIGWAYSRESICNNEFVHTSNTEIIDAIDDDFNCVITPASGTWWIDHINKNDPVKVIYYDYNSQSLEYWKEHAPRIDNVSYKFLNINLLTTSDYSWLCRSKDKTVINLSNIFCYEGTSMFTSLAYRQYKENEVLAHLPKDYYVLFTGRASLGFNTNASYYGQNLPQTDIKELIKPTWHMNQDWHG